MSFAKLQKIDIKAIEKIIEPEKARNELDIIEEEKKIESSRKLRVSEEKVVISSREKVCLPIDSVGVEKETPRRLKEIAIMKEKIEKQKLEREIKTRLYVNNL